MNLYDYYLKEKAKYLKGGIIALSVGFGVMLLSIALNVIGNNLSSHLITVFSILSNVLIWYSLISMGAGIACIIVSCVAYKKKLERANKPIILTEEERNGLELRLTNAKKFYRGFKIAGQIVTPIAGILTILGFFLVWIGSDPQIAVMCVDYGTLLLPVGIAFLVLAGTLWKSIKTTTEIRLGIVK